MACKLDTSVRPFILAWKSVVEGTDPWFSGTGKCKARVLSNGDTEPKANSGLEWLAAFWLAIKCSPSSGADGSRGSRFSGLTVRETQSKCDARSFNPPRAILALRLEFEPKGIALNRGPEIQFGRIRHASVRAGIKNSRGVAKR